MAEHGRLIDADALWMNFIHSMDVCDDILEIIEKQPTIEPEQHWIPCSERLPDKEGYYLTTTMYQEVYSDYWNGDNFNRTEMIIAWMPLPEPWEGEQDGKDT